MNQKVPYTARKEHHLLCQSWEAALCSLTFWVHSCKARAIKDCMLGIYSLFRSVFTHERGLPPYFTVFYFKNEPLRIYVLKAPLSVLTHKTCPAKDRSHVTAVLFSVMFEDHHKTHMPQTTQISIFSASQWCRLVVVNQGDFVPQRRVSNVWRHFGCQNWGRSGGVLLDFLYWAESRDAAQYFTMHQTAQHKRISWPQMLMTLRLRSQSLC